MRPTWMSYKAVGKCYCFWPSVLNNISGLLSELTVNFTPGPVLHRVRYILNVTREIDNFFPGLFEYHNIRVYDEEATNLLEYWNDTYKFISKAK